VTNVSLGFVFGEVAKENVRVKAYYVSPSEKEKGTRGRVPHLIAPTAEINLKKPRCA